MPSSGGIGGERAQTAGRKYASSNQGLRCDANRIKRLLSPIVLIVATKPRPGAVAAAGRFLPMLVSTKRREVEIVEGADEQSIPAFVRRIGVVDVVAVAEKDTRPVSLGRSVPGEIGEISIVVLDRAT